MYSLCQFGLKLCKPQKISVLHDQKVVSVLADFYLQPSSEHPDDHKLKNDLTSELTN